MPTFRIASDLHLESLRSVKHEPTMLTLTRERLPVMEGESEHVLLLAGDIITVRDLATTEVFFRDVCARFKQVLYIPGNHEYWYGVFPTAWDTFHKTLLEDWQLKNVLLQGLDMLIYDADENTRVIGSTLWTDFDEANPLAMTYAGAGMVDYEVTKLLNGNKLRPMDILDVHAHQRLLMMCEIVQAKTEGKKVLVMSHHSPLRESTHPRYAGQAINAAFCSDMGNEIAAHKPDVWVHGHMHDHTTYKYGEFDETTVICNPHGYMSERHRNKYNPTLTITL